jgi:hypothetical protein
MSCKKSLWDHYLDAIRLLSRAEVHLEFYEKEMEGKPTAEIVADLRSQITEYMNRKPPSA